MHLITRSNVIVFIFLVFHLSGCHPKGEEAVTVSDMRCELLSNPEGIDSPNPRLCWNIHSENRNIRQVAYQILVASDPSILAIDSGDLWNSGRVLSDQSVHIPYQGKRLLSRQRCYWKVRVWSRKGKSPWSETASWSMGLLNYKDWQGRWIGFDRAFPWDRIERFSRLSARYFRKEFEIKEDKTVRRATVYIMGPGLYELYINGDRIGDQVLAPSPTDYTRNVKYNTFNVTPYLHEGRNAIGTILGNGRYFTMRQNYKPYKIKNFGYPKMLLNLYIEYTDGTEEVISTDNSWKGTADGPIRSNNEYDGEEYDARKEMPGWNRVGFDATNWLNADYVQEPGGRYEAQANENMKIMKTIRPVTISGLPGDRYMLDAGQNMAGWLRVRVKGNKGDRLTLRFGESLKEDGELFVANLRDARATDTYILKGGGEEIWEPRFVYHGFRYVEISGFPGKPVPDDFVVCVVYDNIPVTGFLETSDSMINRIYSNAVWSVKSSYKGMPVDCPQRNERMPWLGDRATGCYGESFILDNSRLYIKWLDDINYAQKAEGSIPDVAPPFFRYYSDNMTWPGTYLFVAQMLYHQYGLVEPIRKHYPSMKKWLFYMQQRYLVDYIMTRDSYGDWCAPPGTIAEGKGMSANVKHPSSLIATAYYYRCLLMMEDFARLSGNLQDVSEYSVQAEKVKDAFNTNYFDARHGSYGENTLTENLLPLYFNMVPEMHRQALVENIRNIIMEENKGHLSTGMVGVQWLMRSLAENGMEDIAFKLATNTTFPGWGYMVDNGATTIWELWNANTAAPDMNSQNHVMMLGDLIIWFYEYLAGIRSDEENAGYKKIILKPSFNNELDYVNASYQSVHGKIVSHWKRQHDSIIWNISIPANTVATVDFPVDAPEFISIGEESLKKTDGIHSIQSKQGTVILGIGSGSYTFKFKTTKQ